MSSSSLYYEFLTTQRHCQDSVFVPMDITFPSHILPSMANLEGLAQCFSASFAPGSDDKLVMETFRDLKKSNPLVIFQEPVVFANRLPRENNIPKGVAVLKRAVRALRD